MRRNAEKAFLAALDARGKQGRDTSDSINSPNFAPRVMVGMDPCAGFKRRDLKKAMDALFNSDEIMIETFGRPGSPGKRIVRRAELSGH